VKLKSLFNFFGRTSLGAILRGRRIEWRRKFGTSAEAFDTNTIPKEEYEEAARKLYLAPNSPFRNSTVKNWTWDESNDIDSLWRAGKPVKTTMNKK
jgi:hypothetical protein